MFDLLDDLEAVLDKFAADEGPVDVVRVSKLTERLEFQRLRAIGAYDRSAGWLLDGFVSAQSALRSKCRLSTGHAHGAVVLARKLDQLPETAAAFRPGEIGGTGSARARVHAERDEMLDGIEAELVAFAPVSTPTGSGTCCSRSSTPSTGMVAPKATNAELAKNKITLSSTLHGRGVLNGSLDAELTELGITMFDAEIEQLREAGETRTMPQLRAAAFESIARQYLAGRGMTDARVGARPTSASWPTSPRSRRWIPNSRPISGPRPPTGACSPGDAGTARV